MYLTGDDMWHHSKRVDKAGSSRSMQQHNVMRKLACYFFPSIQLAPAWTQRLQLQLLCVTPVPATHGTALRYS
jgi:hypothetical protein